LKWNLEIDDDDDVKLFEACHNQVVPKATCAAERWNTSHRGHFCLHNCDPPNKKQEIDCCVTPETEACALLAIRGNWILWHVQFPTAAKHPNCKQKSIHAWPSEEVIKAPNDIKAWLCRGQNDIDELLELPEGWQNKMKLKFEGTFQRSRVSLLRVTMKERNLKNESGTLFTGHVPIC